MTRTRNIRGQFEMSPKSMERLRILKDKTEATSYAEVFRNALKFYEFMVEQAELGNELVIEDPKDHSKRTVLVHR